MRSLVLASSLMVPLLLAAGSAAAQSAPPGVPGTCECVPMAPGQTPIGPMAAPVAAPQAEPWQDQTWGLALHVGGMGLDDGTEVATDYSMAGLAARYRASRRLEIELALDGGREQLPDGTEGDREVRTTTLSLLVHMRPHARLDWYLLGGVGSTARRWRGAQWSDADESAHVALGAGLEYRFEHLVLGLDVRALALAATEVRQDIPTTALASPSPTREDSQPGGGQATLSVGWFF